MASLSETYLKEKQNKEAGLSFRETDSVLQYLHKILGYKISLPNLSYNLNNDNQSGPSCSKLTTSLFNDSLKFTSSDTQIR